MAHTFAFVKREHHRRGIRRGIVDITLDSNGPTFAVAASDLNLTEIINIVPPAHKAGYHIEWDHVNGNIKAYEEADTTSASGAADASDLNGEVLRCEYVGR
jgi:hypothetical protein